MAVSTASIWQKKGRTPWNWWCAPVLQQARGLGRDLPLLRVGQRAPGVHVAAELVDDRGRVVLLLGRAEAFVVGGQLQLDLRDRALGCLALLRLGHGRDQVRAAA